MADSEAKTALQLIQKDLDLPESRINQNNTPEFEELHRYLCNAIANLLDSDFNKLLNALYRIDVSEQKVSEAINLETPGEIASKLASLVIERELQKVRTRRKYANKRE